MSHLSSYYLLGKVMLVFQLVFLASFYIAKAKTKTTSTNQVRPENFLRLNRDMHI